MKIRFKKFLLLYAVVKVGFKKILLLCAVVKVRFKKIIDIAISLSNKNKFIELCYICNKAFSPIFITFAPAKDNE